MNLYLIRHGETDWNKARRIQGSSDIPLNEYGRELAFSTREGLSGIPFDIAYTSPLKRARETGEIVLGGRNVPLFEDERIAEADFGSYEGRLEAELIEEKDPVLRFFDCPEKFVKTGGCEDHKEVMERAEEFLKDRIFPHEKEYQNIAVFSHGALIHGILTYIYQREIKDFWHAPKQLNCGVTIIEIANNKYHVIEESKIFYSVKE